MQTRSNSTTPVKRLTKSLNQSPVVRGTPGDKRLRDRTAELVTDKENTPTRRQTPRQQVQKPSPAKTKEVKTVGKSPADIQPVKTPVKKAEASISPKAPLRLIEVDPIFDALPSAKTLWEKRNSYQLKDCFRLHGLRDGKNLDLHYPEVWACKFAPRTPKEIASDTKVHVVATCGLNSVCFTDCDQSRVIMKFPHLDEPNEQFHCLAWTVLPHPMNGHVRVLAAAGRLKSIKLIDTDQHICYRNIHGHTGDIVDMQFCRQRPYWLLSASEDATVRLWDIGDLTDEGRATCLRMFDITTPALKIALSPLEDFFLVSNQDCVIVQHDLDPIIQLVRSDQEFKPVKYLDEPLEYPDGDGWHTSPVDFLQFINEDYVVSKGSLDELWLWCNSGSDETRPDLHRRATYESDGSCFVGGAVAVSKGKALAVVGSYKGDLLMYDITPVKTDEKAASVEGPLFKISHPDSKALLRQVDISYDAQYIVTVDSDDCVWIWQSK
jgi:WD40 repeat protein